MSGNSKMGVKIFEENSCESLNKAINNWLSLNSSVTIIDSNIQVVKDPIFQNALMYICIISYRRW